MQIKNIAFWHVNELGLDRVEQSRRALGTLVVREDSSALDAAKAADALGEQARVVVLVNANDEATGVFVPAEFMTKLRELKGIQANNLTDALTQLANDPQEQQREFHHEFFNEARPLLVWCQVGSHYSADPCADHS